MNSNRRLFQFVVFVVLNLIATIGYSQVEILDFIREKSTPLDIVSDIKLLREDEYRVNIRDDVPKDTSVVVSDYEWFFSRTKTRKIEYYSPLNFEIFEN